MNKDLTIGTPRKTLWLYCLPLLGSVLFQQLYNLADSIVAGRFISENALAAVGNSSEITLIYIAFAIGSNIGCSIITSQLFGAKNYLGVKSAVSTAFIAFGVMCLLLMTFGFTCGGFILKLMNTPETIFDDSLLYLNIYTAGMIFVFFYNIATGVFSALGDSKTPFVFLAISSLANIGVDILFVTTFNMGIAGVAWATFICQGLSCILALIVLLMRLRSMKTEGKFKVFSKVLFKKLSIVAIPSIFQQVFISIGNIVVQGVVNQYGESVIAGYTAALKLNNIATAAFMANANGLSAYIAQNIGAKKIERIHPGFKNGQYLNWIIALPLFCMFMFAGKYCVGIFLEGTASQIAIDTGRQMLMILSPFYFIVSMKITSDGALRGAGAMKLFMITTFADLFLRVVFVIIFSKIFGRTTAIWFAWGIGWAVGAALSIVMYYKGSWKKYLGLMNDIN